MGNATEQSDSIKYRYYLGDLGYWLKENALEARKEREFSRNTPGEEFHAGYLHAYYAVISHMQNQAEVFDISLEDLQLEGIDPDQDLL